MSSPSTPPPLPGSDAHQQIVEQAQALTREGTRLMQTDRQAEAESKLREALSLAETKLGLNHATTGICLCNLGEFLSQAGRLDEAETTLRRAVTLEEALYGNGHSSTGTSLNNLALVLRRQEKFAEAEALYRQVLAIFEQQLGPDHIHVAGVMNNLSQVIQRTGPASDVEPFMRRSIAIFEKEFGENHPNVAIVVNNLAQYLDRQGRRSEAEPLSRRHLRIFQTFEETTGNRHAHKVDAIQNYGELVMRMGLSLEDTKQRIRDLLAGKELPPVVEDTGDAAPAAVETNSEPDFDALSRAAIAESNEGRDAKDRLFATVFRLEQWHFIARGTAPDFHAYGARNESIANGAPMLKAFTDTKKLHAFAKENQLTAEDGSVTILSLPSATIQPTLDSYATQGVTHVHFNADASSDGFFIPIERLPRIREHLSAKGLL